MKRLVPFIEKHHFDRNYIFWHDLTSVYYAKDALAVLHSKNIHFVKKDVNPPNVPQLRPIETFWAHLKSKVYEGDWKCQNLQQLRSRINRKIQEFPPDYFSGLFRNLKTKIRCAAENGPYSIL